VNEANLQDSRNELTVPLPEKIPFFQGSLFDNFASLCGALVGKSSLIPEIDHDLGVLKLNPLAVGLGEDKCKCTHPISVYDCVCFSLGGS
jgi:hypothetical protein